MATFTVSRREHGRSEEAHPNDDGSHLFAAGRPARVRARRVPDDGQRALPARLHVAAPVLGRRRMLPGRVENLLAVSHRVRVAAVFRKYISECLDIRHNGTHVTQPATVISFWHSNNGRYLPESVTRVKLPLHYSLPRTHSL